jgi:hypothetical protein
MKALGSARSLFSERPISRLNQWMISLQEMPRLESMTALKRAFSEKADQLTSEHRTLLTAMLDTLVDGGVRGAGFVSKNFHAPVNSKGGIRGLLPSG